MAGEIERFAVNLDDELNSTALYYALADVEKDSRIAEVYKRLAKTEQKHADVWANKIRKAGGTISAFKPSWRTQTLIG